MKLKFYLHKFDKLLYFQMIYIDDSILNKKYFEDESHVCIGTRNEWGSQFSIYPDGANFGGTIGHTRRKTLLLNFTTSSRILKNLRKEWIKYEM